jgi:hypothetical protein
VLFRDRAAAAAAAPPGQNPWRVEHAPGGDWWARTEQEAKFLENNLTEPTRGTNLVSSFVHYANAFIRTPGLLNPLPHLTKNMGMKYLLARGPAGAYDLPRKVMEYARGSNPTRLAEFEEAMPFSKSGKTAQDILHTELHEGTIRDAIKHATRAATAPSRAFSQKMIFKYGDPAMRYALYDSFRRKGMDIYEAGNHAWVDLVRYGTRSWFTDEWKSIPMNFFVPWRFGTVASVAKQLGGRGLQHGLATAATIGTIEYLREMRYRQTGRWMHLPIDYVEKPIAQIVQERNPYDLPAIVGTMAVFGPGGDFAASELKDMLASFESGSGRGLQDPAVRQRMKNMFWGISQLYEVPKEIHAGLESGDPERWINAFVSLATGEHDALNYEPRRLGKFLPESMPGMKRSDKVALAEALQEQRRRNREKMQERMNRPRPSISERVGGR